MESVKTSKGTVLPLMNLKGKSYLQVAHRLMWFREDHPDGAIVTEILSVTDEQTIAKASIHVKNKETNTYHLVATGTKRETKKDFADHTEKAETGAIGRALALIGYGTQFALELDEGTRIVDSPMAQAAAAPATTASAQAAAVAAMSAPATKTEGFRRPGSKAPATNKSEFSF